MPKRNSFNTMAGMDNDTNAFRKTTAVQPGHSGGPVLEGAGTLLGVTVARTNDVAEPLRPREREKVSRRSRDG